MGPRDQRFRTVSGVWRWTEMQKWKIQDRQKWKGKNCKTGNCRTETAGKCGTDVAVSGLPELIPVLGSQPAGDVSHKHGGRLPLLSTRPAVTLATFRKAATNFAAWWIEARWVWTVCLRLLPDSVAAASPTAPESSTLTTRLRSHPRAAWYAC